MTDKLEKKRLKFYFKKHLIIFSISLTLGIGVFLFLSFHSKSYLNYIDFLGLMIAIIIAGVVFSIIAWWAYIKSEGTRK